MSRPTTAPDWATATNYTAGTYAGQTNKSTPPAGNVAEGFNAGYGLPIEWLNERLHNHGEWINYLDTRQMVRATFSEWSGAIGVSTAYAGPFKIVWTGANPPALGAFAASFNAPYVTVDAPLNTNSSIIVAGATAGLAKITSSFRGTFAAYVRMSIQGANDSTIYAGFFNTLGTNFRGCAFIKASTDTNWQCKTNDNAATTTNDSGVPPVADFQQLRIEIYGSGLSGGLRAEFYIDGVLVATNTTHIETSAVISPIVAIVATAVTANVLYCGEPTFAWNAV